MRFNKTLKNILIIAVFAALLWAGSKWFGEKATDDLSDHDGGRGKYEDAIENS